MIDLKVFFVGVHLHYLNKFVCKLIAKALFGQTVKNKTKYYLL